MADGIKIGNLDISAFKVGSSDCKIYLGDTLLYPTTPPVFEGKYKLTLSDSSTVSAECDGTSAVTSGEVASQYSGSVVSAEIGNCVTSIGDRVFYNCTSLTSITIGNSVTSIGQWAFYGCSNLTSIDFPDNVTTIGKSIMRGCNSLSTVTIGSGITSIGASVFFNCTGLTSVTIEATTPPSIGTLVFENTNDCPIYVPSGSVSAYQSAWSEYEYSSRIQAIQPTQTLQWVTFSNGDTIPSDLQIYGIKGIVNDLNIAFDGYADDIYVEDAGRNKFNVLIGGYYDPCYSEYDIVLNTSVEYIFSNIGCSDYYTVSSKTIADMSNDIQLLIYA